MRVLSSIAEGQVKLSCWGLQDTSGISLLHHMSSFPPSPTPHHDNRPSLLWRLPITSSVHIPETKYPMDRSETPEFFLLEKKEIEEQLRTSNLQTFRWT